MTNHIHLTPNVPVTLALQNPEGELAQYNQVHYSLVDGRTLTVSCETAAKLNMLELEAGQTFGICKRWSGRKHDPVEFDVWATPATERERAAQEEPADIEEQLRQSIEIAARRPRVVRKPPAPQPRLFEDHRGNGTTGPAPVPAAALATAPAQPKRQGPIPYNVAFREVTQFVTKELKTIGEQWDDDSRQGMVSTILIAAAKQGLLGPWERES